MLPIIFNYYGRTDNGSLLVGAMDVQGEKNTSLYRDFQIEVQHSAVILKP